MLIEADSGGDSYHIISLMALLQAHHGRSCAHALQMCLKRSRPSLRPGITLPLYEGGCGPAARARGRPSVSSLSAAGIHIIGSKLARQRQT
eukprot:398370-Pleurochrysis_carterae.AAC.1